MITHQVPTLPNYDFARPEMLRFVPQSAHQVLDVGCSTGKFGMALRARPDTTVTGVEPDPAAAELAKDRLDSVCTGFFPETERLVARVEGYDAIVFNDVLEHMSDPRSALDAAKRLLAPDGVVVASIPNVRHISALGPLLIRDSWHYTDIGVLDRTHLRFFTRTSLIAFLRDAGWDVVSIAGINRCRRMEIGDTRGLKILSALSRRRTDPFFFLQYAVVARPAGAPS
jgi:2-polyprenyl-3-methyl-5-hydroxy-6-metoxy-1,4-benzoquinol methylase